MITRICIYELAQSWLVCGRYHQFVGTLVVFQHGVHLVGAYRELIERRVLLGKQVTKRKWSLSNLMTVVHILLNSYINLYNFLNLPEGQWLRSIQNRSQEDDTSPQLELFPKKEGPNYENYKTNAYLQAVNQQN